MPKASILNAFENLKIKDSKAKDKQFLKPNNIFDLLVDDGHAAIETSKNEPVSSKPTPNQSTANSRSKEEQCDQNTGVTSRSTYVHVRAFSSSRTVDATASRATHPQPGAPPTNAASRTHLEYIMSRKDWRKDDAEAQEARKTRIEQARTVGKSIKGTERTKYTIRVGPRTSSGVLHVDQILGAIVFHHDVRPLRESQKCPGGWKEVTVNEKRCMSKGRYYLILKQEGQEIFEAAIYTNGDKGLAKVLWRLWKNYLSVKPVHIDAKKFVNQNPGYPVLDVVWMAPTTRGHDEAKLDRHTMVVNLADVQKRHIDQPDLRLVASISGEAQAVALKRARALGSRV